MVSVVKVAGISIRPIDITDRVLIAYWAAMLSEYSWGWDYPVKPWDEIIKAEYIAGAFAQDVLGSEHLVGAACINRNANNDGKGNRDMWFSGWVVLPRFRRKGVGRALHDQCVAYGVKQKGPIRASSETEYMDLFFASGSGWVITETRTTARNEDGKPMMLYEHMRSQRWN